MESAEEAKAPVVAKKVWNILRLALIMLRKGIAKSSKISLELHLLLKRGKLAGKAFAHTTLMLHHHFAAAFSSSRSHNSHRHFIPPPREYEFSCSNSPAVFPFAIKRKHKLSNKSHQYDDVSTITAFHKVLEILNSNSNSNYENNYSSKFVEASSPLVTLPGFGKSPIGRKLRVTDSPFPVKDDDGGDCHVDLAAEEFIRKFYKDLNLQKAMAVLDSPCPNNNNNYLWDR